MSFTPISQITADSTWNTTFEPAGSADLGRDEFLQLLVAQLANQDPMNPADPSQFASQLAQYSSLEQMMDMNTGIQTMALLQASMNNSQVRYR